MEKENYKSSMLFELIDLERKMANLARFIGKEADNMPIPKEKMELMVKQCEIMHEYSDILTRRLLLELED